MQNKIFDFKNADPLFEEAAQIIVDRQTGSFTLLQRHFKIGFNRSGRLIDQLEEAQIIGPYENNARKVLIKDKIHLNAVMLLLKSGQPLRK